MYRAGDIVKVVNGPDEGNTREITSVRKYATDNGYYLRGGRGLYEPKSVELIAGRTT